MSVMSDNFGEDNQNDILYTEMSDYMLEGDREEEQ